MATKTCNYWLVSGDKDYWLSMARSLTKLLNKYGLMKKIIAYVKDEGSNINAMSITLKVVVNYDSLGLEKSFQGTCFGHVFSKACQYGTAKEKM